ncbi:LRR receptor-like serine threonine-protein kinase [Seminavis robusta]|uniref:LRR receptor-like serine threonine-protein kinase n=1 Tax=Seminavis robusta TaxID=568900 RepID=A0A9N8EUB7_9STRA|nr:LRR receptor-like serine threonine-protein kinase [Seminavis robusta]|eukprot:Sro1707_g292650.1 LRR receptor-like serine threonine-protein kinase (866) ;mRNA; r:20712-23394
MIPAKKGLKQAPANTPGVVEVPHTMPAASVTVYRGLRRSKAKESEQSRQQAISLVSSSRHGNVPVWRGLQKNRQLLTKALDEASTVSPEKTKASSEIEEMSSLSDSFVEPTLRFSRTSPTSPLIVAVPVSEELPLYLPQAEWVDPDEMERRRLRKKKNCCYWTFTMLFPIFPMLLVLGLVILKKQQGEVSSARAPQTPSPTVAVVETPPPTEIPSSTDEYVRSLLPPISLQKIDVAQSPQNQAFRWLLEDPLLPDYPDLRIVQRYALATIYYAFGGNETWFNNSNWLSHDARIHECDWFSHIVDHDNVQHSVLNLTGRGHDAEVVFEAPLDICRTIDDDPTADHSSGGDNRKRVYQELWLQTNGLKGTVPDELYLLTHLKVINLGSGNAVQGTLSSMVGNLKELEVLSFSSSQLTSTLPSELGLARNLRVVVMTSNQLSGTIATEIFGLSHLQHLWLEENNFHGTVAPDIEQLSSLETLYMFSNALQGTLPNEIGSLTSLKELSLRNNNFQGHVPTGLSLMSNMTVLFLSNNQLSGWLPSELGVLTNMIDFQISGNSLTSGIPTEFGSLTGMTNLYLYDNRLSKSIPSELGLITSMVDFELQGNRLSGSLPTELGSLTAIKWFWLFGNKLSGSIPSELQRATSLIDFSLFDNHLSNKIPSELSMLSGLEFLWLQQNQLTGPIPSQLGLCSSLKSIKLSNNSLTSTLPVELSNSLVTLNTLDLRFNQGLSGSVPTAFCKVSDFHCSRQLCGCHCHCTSQLYDINDMSDNNDNNDIDDTAMAPLDTNSTSITKQNNASSALLRNVSQSVNDDDGGVHPPETLENEGIGPFDSEEAEDFVNNPYEEVLAAGSKTGVMEGLEPDKWIFY